MKTRKVSLASTEFAARLAVLTKAQLIDTLWCATQLGTDESADQILTQAARNVQIAMELRGDQCPGGLAVWAKARIDSDGGAR